MAENEVAVETIYTEDSTLFTEKSTSILNQPQATQSLCDQCQRIFQSGNWHKPTEPGGPVGTMSSGTVDHHPTYDSFINSVIQGCYICVLLWERIPQDAKKILPTLCSENALLQCSYFTQHDNKLQLKHIQVNTNSAYDLALYQPGTNDIMVSLQGFPANDLDQHKPTIDAGTSTNSTAAFACIAKWLESCSNHHASCGYPDQSHYTSRYPTRLLDVGAYDSSNNNIKLVETNAVVLEGPYVTLSHCWGRGHVISLTKTTIKQFLQGLPAVPKTYEDAIVVARNLHVRYLWIDSLCIIQNDPDDWRTESLLMDQVYKNALFNIAATAASDSNEGLFYSRSRLVPYCQVQLGEEKIRFIDTSLFTAEVENAPLMQRAWVLQERLLAPKVVHFGRKQLFWECNELCASETFPDRQPPRAPHDTQQIRARINAISSKSGSIIEEQRREALEIWRFILWLYTSCNLTFGTDKLRALAGIVKSLQPLFGNDYLAGIWKDSIILLLGWYCHKGNRGRILPRPAESRAPTWSWASTDNSITFWLPFPRSETIFDLKVLAFEATTMGDDPAPHSADSCLFVEGPLNLITVDENPVSIYDSVLFQGERIGRITATNGAPWLDEYTESVVDFYCLPLHHTVIPQNRNPGEYDDVMSMSSQDNDIYQISFLLLKPRIDDFGSYTRCGVWRSEGTEKLLRVQNGHAAPCEEFLGSERGQRIRIW